MTTKLPTTTRHDYPFNSCLTLSRPLISQFAEHGLVKYGKSVMEGWYLCPECDQWRLWPPDAHVLYDNQVAAMCHVCTSALSDTLNRWKCWALQFHGTINRVTCLHCHRHSCVYPGHGPRGANYQERRADSHKRRK